MYVVGHKSPDTDSVCAAIAVADLKNKLGQEAKPIMQGELGPETEFVLKKFGVEAPEIMTDATDKEIYLVDHSDLSQSLDNLDKASKIIGIADHHKLGDVTTVEPLELWALPVGCSCTVIKNMYDFYNVPIDGDIAGLMASAILSDTVIFKSATCTDADRIAVEQLAQLAGITDAKEYGMEMFKAKSAVDGVSANELIFRDFKDLDMSGNKVGVGQLEVVDLSVFDNIKKDLFEELKNVKADGRNTAILILTDIMKEGSEILFVSENPEVISKALNFELPSADAEVPTAWLEGVMSRKKQVVPQLMSEFANSSE